ncbi:hypothetical protein FPHOBKDP_00218 [Listeria phage LPJP1]|nr:hypothetical protein FPHOBKDP_00218 [Listeria phage LPJP1]
MAKKDDSRLMNELTTIFIPQIKNIHESDKIDLIVIAGDLFDRILKFDEVGGKLVLNFMQELIEWTNKNNIYFRIIQGTKTHDYNQLAVFRKAEVDNYNFKIYETVYNEKLTINEKEFNILYLPEEYPEDMNDYYKEFFDVQENTYDMIFGHGMIDFVAFTGYEDDTEKIVKKAPVFVADDLIKITKGPICFGHIHDYHEYKKQIYYSGSFSRYSHGDTMDKGYLYIKLNSEDTSEYEISFYVNELAPTYATIDLDKIKYDNMEDLASLINDSREEYDFIRIKSTNNNDSSIVRKVIENSPNIKVTLKNKNNEEQQVDSKWNFILDRELDTDDSIKKFIKIKYDKDIDISKIKAILNPEIEDIDDIIKNIYDKKK